jgi:hypothetical protein
MQNLKRSQCTVLSLVLTRRWFVEIGAGRKREEYRVCNRYWAPRFRNWGARAMERNLYMVVEFRLGYAKNAPRLFFRADAVCLVGRQLCPRTEWGEPRVEHYAICLGAQIHLEDD